jgi:hypothetical protein
VEELLTKFVHIKECLPHDFAMKNFKHIAKLKMFYSDHPHINLLESIINILLYLYYNTSFHLFISTHIIHQFMIFYTL